MIDYKIIIPSVEIFSPCYHVSLLQTLFLFLLSLIGRQLSSLKNDSFARPFPFDFWNDFSKQSPITIGINKLSTSMFKIYRLLYRKNEWVAIVDRWAVLGYNCWQICADRLEISLLYFFLSLSKLDSCDLAAQRWCILSSTSLSLSEFDCLLYSPVPVCL